MENLDYLIHIYKEAERVYDIEGRAECYLSLSQISAKMIPSNVSEFFTQNSAIVMLAVFQALQRQDGKMALCYLDCLSDGGRIDPWQGFYRGLSFYCIGAWNEAAEAIQRYIVCEPDDIAYFYLGNICFRQGRWKEAVDNYIYALERRESCFEAVANAALAMSRMGEKKASCQLLINEQIYRCWLRGDITMFPWESLLDIKDEDYKNIPIFINSRDRLCCLQRLINWLQDADYNNLYILDNDSTYPELLHYYVDLENQGVKIVRFNKNWGHTAIWSSGILEQLRIRTPYVYTDSDVVPIESCPKDIVRHLLGVLRRYNFLLKAGMGIYCQDITSRDAEQVKAFQKQFYRHPMESNLYFGAIDTTFALYRNIRVYTLPESARTTGNAMIYHLPWYFDYDNLPEDEQYYIEHANSSATTATLIKQRKV